MGPFHHKVSGLVVEELWNAQGKMVFPFLQCKHVLLSMLGLIFCQKMGLAQFLVVFDLQLVINIVSNNQHSTTYKIMYTLTRIKSILQHKNCYYKTRGWRFRDRHFDI